MINYKLIIKYNVRFKRFSDKIGSYRSVKGCFSMLKRRVWWVDEEECRLFYPFFGGFLGDTPLRKCLIVARIGDF